MLRSLPALLLLLGLGASPALAQEEPVEEARATGTEVVLKVDGFECDMCAARLQKRLEDFDEVATIDTGAWEEGFITLHRIPDAELKEDRLVKTVKEEGFVLREIRIGDEVTLIDT